MTKLLLDFKVFVCPCSRHNIANHVIFPRRTILVDTQETVRGSENRKLLAYILYVLNYILISTNSYLQFSLCDD